VLQPLSVNKFTVLKIKNINIDNSKPKDIYFLSSTPDIYPSIQRLRWKKQLSKELSANALNMYRIFLTLSVELCTTDTSKFHSVSVLLDCRATGNFIDHDFVYSKGINT